MTNIPKFPPVPSLFCDILFWPTSRATWSILHTKGFVEVHVIATTCLWPVSAGSTPLRTFRLVCNGTYPGVFRCFVSYGFFWGCRFLEGYGIYIYKSIKHHDDVIQTFFPGVEKDVKRCEYLMHPMFTGCPQHVLMKLRWNRFWVLRTLGWSLKITFVNANNLEH